jgi:hypothetical protein
MWWPAVVKCEWELTLRLNNGRLCENFVNLVKKYNPQLKELVNKTEIVWEKSHGIKSDKVTADTELKIRNTEGAVDILDSASAKEMAYKALEKIWSMCCKIN